MVYNNFENFSVKYCQAIVEAVSITLSSLPVNLNSIILFGSCARRDMHAGSDVDILILTDRRLNDAALRGKIKNDLEVLSNGIQVDAIFTSVEDFYSSDLRIYTKIKNEGVLLWEKGELTDEYDKLLHSSKKRLPLFK